jgi:hypothetical protein
MLAAVVVIVALFVSVAYAATIEGA